PPLLLKFSQNPTQRRSRIKTQIMLKQDDPKAKEDVSSSVGGEETAIYKFSKEATMDEANPSTIDNSRPNRKQSPRDADES
ncbi:hypothetical protein Bca52824_095328, partial [Brassica carinata]